MEGGVRERVARKFPSRTGMRMRRRESLRVSGEGAPLLATEIFCPEKVEREGGTEGRGRPASPRKREGEDGKLFFRPLPLTSSRARGGEERWKRGGGEGKTLLPLLTHVCARRRVR